MINIEAMTARQLYRGILMKQRTYPSINRKLIIEATKKDIGEWKKITEEDEIAKAMKKMRMLYGHLCMWEEKMAEIHRSDAMPADMSEEDRNVYKGNIIDNPLPNHDINRKKDKDFVYF